MNKADAARLVAIVVTAYPNYDKFRDEQAVTATVNLWASMFAADDSRIVALALNKHIATSKWPPSVAELREIMLEIQRPDLIPPDTAWAAVSDLLHTVGEYNHGDLQNQLPPLVARAVESIGWSTFWEMYRAAARGSGNGGLDRLTFMQQYTPMYEREKARAMTPRQITEQIDSAAAALPDKGQRLLETREQYRREHDENINRIWYRGMERALENAERPQLETGEAAE